MTPRAVEKVESKPEMKPEVVKPEGAEKPKASAKKKSDSAAIAAQARAAILKVTGQKNLTPATTTMPHVGSGSVIINQVVGGNQAKDGKGQICPGYPKKRITEIYGSEGSGKCLVQDTYLSTEMGLLTLGEVFELSGHNPSCTTKVIEGDFMAVSNRFGKSEKISALTWNYRRPVFAVTLSDGSVIKATANHPFLVLEDGFQVWKNLQDLKVGAATVAPLEVPCFGKNSLPLDEAYFLGVLVADGHYGQIRMSITNDDPEVLRVLRQEGPKAFGVSAKEYPTSSPSMDLHFNSKENVSAFYAKWDLKPSLAAEKHFSRKMRTLDKESMGHLLAGYLDCEASFGEASFEVSSASHELLRQTRLMLRAFGVFATVHPKTVKSYPDTPYWRLTVTGGDRATLRDNLPLRRDFGLSERKERATRPIPGVGKLVRSFFLGAETTRQHNKLASDLMSGASEQAAAVLNMLDSAEWPQGDEFLRGHLRRLTEYNYVEVVSVEPCGEEPTFDIVLPETHSFVTEGVVTHNTTLALAAAVEAQKDGGTVMFLDFENALHHGYAQTIGVDFDENKLLLYCPTTLEEGLKMIYIGIKSGVNLIIVDSVAAMVTKSEMEKKIDDPQKIGELAAALSRNLPKIGQWLKESNTALILINQIRSIISSGGYGGHGDTDNSSGGKALKFYMSVRLKLTRIKSEVVKKKDFQGKERNIPFGNVTQVKVVKNKVDKTQGSVGEIFIRYGYGVDEYHSVIECAVTRRLIRKDGAYFALGEERFQGKERLRKYLMGNAGVFSDLKGKVIKALQEADKIALEGDDEIEDDEIVANLKQDLGDDDIFDTGDQAVIEETLAEEDAS